jgi:hypothetical protein
MQKYDLERTVITMGITLDYLSRTPLTGEGIHAINSYNSLEMINATLFILIDTKEKIVDSRLLQELNRQRDVAMTWRNELLDEEDKIMELELDFLESPYRDQLLSLEDSLRRIIEKIDFIHSN